MMQKYWETTGQKKFLLGRRTQAADPCEGQRHQHSVPVCRCHLREACDGASREVPEGRGHVVDFFRDDWKNMDFCQQLIAYHDEAQLEVKRSMVKWKKFESEEACKSFKEEGKVWSDPVHNERGWFRGYCRAGELATIAVREAGKFYKLNVELSAGYMLGTDWASCH
jgi:hypothetical protein